MTLIFPGQRLIGRMSSESVVRLGHDLRDMVLDLEREHAPLLRALGHWWKWYEATPRDKQKTFPFVGAANVVVPLIGVVCDALSSRSLAQATAAAPTYWVTRTENEARVPVARRMARYINWQADGNEFSLKHVLGEMLLEMYVVGRGAAAVNYRHDVRPMFFGRTPLRAATRVTWEPVTWRRGPLVEHVPNEHLLWDRRHRIGDAPVVVRRHEWTWAELRDRAKADDAWDREAVEEVRKWPGVDDGTDTAQVSRVKADLDLRDQDTLSRQLHDVREVWVDWSMLGTRFEVPGDEVWGGQQVPLLAHLHRVSGRVLRLVGMPYLMPYKPFVDLRFRAGRGAAKRLEMMQSIATTAVNQEIDAGTRRNAFWGYTRDAAVQKRPIDPSKLFLVSDMDSIAAFPMPNYTQSALALLTLVNTMAERWMGHSDPLLGRETRSGGHPAPATSTLALLEQVNVMSAGTDVVIQEELSRLGEMVALLGQQFEEPGDPRLAAILGPEDAAAVGEFLFPDEPIPGRYFFDVVALSRTENPDAIMRRTLMTSQAYQNYGAVMAQGAMLLGNPQVPPQAKAVWVKFMEGAGLLLERFLEAANVDDAERYVVQLDQIGVDARNAFSQFTREAAGGLGAGLAGAGAPGAAGGAGGVAASGSLVGAGAGANGRAGGAFTGGGVL